MGTSWRHAVGRTSGLRAVALAAVVGLVLSGCTSSPKPGPTSIVTWDPKTIGEQGWTRERFYGQKVVWQSAIGSEMAVIQAPLNWDDPGAGTIKLVLKRYRATGSADQRIGSLFIIPGGPAFSGLDALDYVRQIAGPDVGAAYDLVSFDQRGVGLSSAVVCGDDAMVDKFVTSDVPMKNQADLESARERVRVFGEACLAATGPLLGEVDSVSVARDLDLTRALLGDKKLNYYGPSYGTVYGADYADLFPEKVGRMVLDSAEDTSLSGDEQGIASVIALEKQLRRYVTECQAGASCPLTGGVDAGMRQVVGIYQHAVDNPYPAGGGATVNGTLASDGIMASLLDVTTWPRLTQALAEVLNVGTATILLGLANAFLGRTPDGTYPNNRLIAQEAIRCLDTPTVKRDYQEMVAFSEQVAAKAPVLGPLLSMGVGCESWPLPATGKPRKITAPGATPILVLGVTGDANTPYEWSVSRADQLESGTLLTWNGEGHLAYGRGGPCVSAAVDSYLLTGVPPAKGTTC